MDEIRKLQRIAHKKDWGIVAHQVPIAFVGVEVFISSVGVIVLGAEDIIVDDRVGVIAGLVPVVGWLIGILLIGMLPMIWAAVAGRAPTLQPPHACEMNFRTM